MSHSSNTCRISASINHNIYIFSIISTKINYTTMRKVRFLSITFKNRCSNTVSITLFIAINNFNSNIFIS